MHNNCCALQYMRPLPNNVNSYYLFSGKLIQKPVKQGFFCLIFSVLDSYFGGALTLSQPSMLVSGMLVFAAAICAAISLGVAPDWRKCFRLSASWRFAKRWPAASQISG